MINDVLDDALNNVQKESDNPNTVSVACINLMTDIKKIYLNQQENLKIITDQKFKKIEKEIEKSKKKPQPGFRFFNAVYTGSVNNKNLPDGKGVLLFQSRNEEFPDENDFYVGELTGGTKTGIGKYTYFNDRNIAKHPFTIPYYLGEWSGDQYYGLGKKIIDTFDDPMTYEGDFRSNKICGFGKYSSTNKEGSIDMIGYFYDGSPMLYGVEIHKDKNDKLINNISGLYSYDFENKSKRLQCNFLDGWEWEKLDHKNYDRKKIAFINSIYEYAQNTLDKIEITNNKFKKEKLKLKIKLMELIFKIDFYWEKNSKHSKFNKLANILNDTNREIDNLFFFKDIDKYRKVVDEGFKTFDHFKKELKKP